MDAPKQFPHYMVTRSDGWPIVHVGKAQHMLFEIFMPASEAEAAEAELAVKQGYLARVVVGQQDRPAEEVDAE